MSEVIKRFGKNLNGRDFFVGDIHGMFGMLEDAMRLVNFDESVDRVFSVGDLVDRGNRSEEVVDWVNKSWFNAVRGNHEDMAIRYPRGNMDVYNYIQNGGGWMTDLNFASQRKISEGLDELPYMIEVETNRGLVGLIHAECPANDWEVAQFMLSSKHAAECKKAQAVALWSRSRISLCDESNVNGIDYLVVGHTPLNKVTRLGNVIFIDTGAVFGTVINLKTGRSDMGILTFLTIDELLGAAND